MGVSALCPLPLRYSTHLITNQIMKKRLLLGCVAFLPFSAGAQLTVIINETWADGNRTNQDLANDSMAWFTSSSGSTLTAQTGSMLQDTVGGGRHALAYFTDAGSPVVLAVGEAIQLNFTVSFPAYHSGSAFGTGDFKVALLNSTGSRVDADSHGGTNADPLNPGFNPTFIPYTGYKATNRLNGGADYTLRKRTEDASVGGNLILGNNAYTLLPAPDGGRPRETLLPATVYNGTLTIERVDSISAVLTYTLREGSTTLINNSSVDGAGHFSFDTVAFSLGGSTASGFQLEQVEISVIPEPSTYALLFGGFGLAWVLIRRRLR